MSALLFGFSRASARSRRGGWRGWRVDPAACTGWSEDLATLDRHIASLRRLAAGARCPDTADTCRADIDRLLDRRAWLTLPVAA